jgi:hypothetical protein
MLDSEDLTGNKRLSYFDFSYYGNISDYGWVAQIDFYTRIGIVKNKDYEKFKALLQTGVYDMIQLKDYCIVSAKPTKIVRNNDNRLDNRNGPAIEFGDGYKQYYINGRAIPEWVFQKVEAGEITREMYLSEKNMEIKSAIYEVMGQQKMMDLLGAEVVDTKHIVHRNGDIETVWLLKTKDTFEEIGDVPFAWVKMICPSTGTVYLGGCDSGHTCAREAMASISPFKPEDYSFDFRS